MSKETSRRAFLKFGVVAAAVVPLVEAAGFLNGVEALEEEGTFVYPRAEIGIVPEVVRPYRVAGGEGGSDQKVVDGFGEVRNMIADPGVIGTHQWDKSADNPNGGNRSAILITPDTQESLESPSAELLLPEGGYMMVTGPRGTIDLGERQISLGAAAGHSWIVVIRGRNSIEGDGNIRARFFDYDQGSTLVTRFPVEADAGAFFGLEYLIQNADHAHQSENCGGGSDGCEHVSLVTLDVNDGAFTVASFEFNGRDYSPSDFSRPEGGNVHYDTSGFNVRDTNLDWNDEDAG